MVTTKTVLLEALRAKIGDSTDDADLKLLEDVSDTMDDFEQRIKDSGDWKTKYEENDKAWKEKYRDRFFNKDVDDEIEKKEKENEIEHKLDENKKLEFSDLFTVGKETN